MRVVVVENFGFKSINEDCLSVICLIVVVSLAVSHSNSDSFMETPSFYASLTEHHLFQPVREAQDKNLTNKNCSDISIERFLGRS